MDLPSNSIDEKQLDTNDLLKLLNINSDLSTKEIINHINNLITNQSDPEVLEFLNEAKKIFSEKKIPIAEQVFKNQYLNQQVDDNLKVVNAAQLLTSAPADVSTYGVQFAEGSKNPRYIETYRSYIILNSAYRENPLKTFSSDFILDIDLKKVLSIKLTSLNIPPSWYSFDYNFGNTNFYVTNGTDISCINLEPGNYDASGLIFQLNNELSNMSIDASFSYNIINNKVSLSSTTDLSFVFYDKNDICDVSSCFCPCSKQNYNLGYYLGFRGPPQQKDAFIIDKNFGIHINAGETIKAISQLNLNNKINAILSIDDYNNSVFSEKIKLVPRKDNHLKLPSYYNTDISCNNNNNLYSPAVFNPRQLSMAKLYTIQEIRRQDPNSYTLTPQYTTNTLAVFTLEAGKYFSHTYSVDETSAKIYTGPINIQRLKVTIKNSHGHFLDLHYMDWECVLEIEQFYQ